MEAIAEQVGTKARSTDVACSTDRYTATYVVAPSLGPCASVWLHFADSKNYVPVFGLLLPDRTRTACIWGSAA